MPPREIGGRKFNNLAAIISGEIPTRCFDKLATRG
jgi:hypothetical protein